MDLPTCSRWGTVGVRYMKKGASCRCDLLGSPREKGVLTSRALWRDGYVNRATASRSMLWHPCPLPVQVWVGAVQYGCVSSTVRRARGTACWLHPPQQRQGLVPDDVDLRTANTVKRKSSAITDRLQGMCPN